MKKLLLLITALLALSALSALSAPPALAGEAEIRLMLKAKFPNARVDGIQAGPMPGLFEVRFQTQAGVQLLYTDTQGNFLFDGSIIDAKTSRNLTEERMQKLTAIEFSALPLDMAVKVQRGNGKRQVAMFSDPYCPYCRRLEQTLLQIDDVTIYVFMYPVIRPDKADHSRAVWCAPDRAKAWLELAASDNPKVPASGASCSDPVDKVLELGRSLRVNGTPTLFFPNGERAIAAWTVEQLRAKLDATARVTAKK